MGLDAVELIMKVEEVFGVHIEDAEAEGCVTPRILIDVVWSKVDHADQPTCSSQHAFYITRAALMAAFGVDRNSVTPAAPLSRFIPEEDQPASWALLRVAMRSKSWPDLVRPRRVTALIHGLTLFVLVALGVGVNWWFSIPVAIAISAGAHFLTEPWKNRIPQHMNHVSDLTRLASSSRRMEWSREGVAMEVKRIVMEMLAVPDERYSEDASFVKDYGC